MFSIKLVDKPVLLKIYYSVFLGIAILLIFAIINDIYQIHIYRHDSLYYYPQKYYLQYKVFTEGRWLNYLFYPIVTLFSGNLLSLFILLSFFYFVYYCTRQWTKSSYYSILLSLLYLQIPPLYSLILWPATAAPAFLVLILSAFFVKRISMIYFFIIFGVLFFATMSNFYYLLPLLYLNQLKYDTIYTNLKQVFKILLSWTIGFVISYAITQLIVFIYSGHIMYLAPWRNPHYIHSLTDIIENVISSFNYLQRDIDTIFFNIWLIISYILALLLVIIFSKKNLFIPSLIIYFFIIFIHYVIIIPVGIYVSPRTVIATWIGIYAIAFSIPKIKQWQILVLSPLLIYFIFMLYQKNNHNLNWYSSITNTYYNYLLKEVPHNPSMYKGIIFLGQDADIYQRNYIISKKLSLYKTSTIEGLDSFMRWAPIAHEAGFKSVIMCNNRQGRNDLSDHSADANKICKNVNLFIEKNLYSSNEQTFYKIIGIYNNRLIVSLNAKWSSVKVSY